MQEKSKLITLSWLLTAITSRLTDSQKMSCRLNHYGQNLKHSTGMSLKLMHITSAHLPRKLMKLKQSMKNQPSSSPTPSPEKVSNLWKKTSTGTANHRTKKKP